MTSTASPSTAAQTAGAREADLQVTAERFPEDMKVAMATAQSLRGAPPNPPHPAMEPWPPMQVPT